MTAEREDAVNEATSGAARPERLLTPEQVAERLGITKITAKAWLRTGKLPVTKLGERGLLRCRESDLDAYIRALAEGQRKGAKP
jgi:excisionase family DNA binding protein